MKTYPQQHEPWRPDYPTIWMLSEGGIVYEDNEEDLTEVEQMISINAFSIANSAIKRACNYD